jgi:hypothetical protein
MGGAANVGRSSRVNRNDRRTRSRISKVIGLGAAVALLVTMGGSSLTAGAARNSFVGDFDLVYEGTTTVQGRVKAVTFEPTSQRLVPGSFDFRGAADFFVRETHALISGVDYWHDPNHPEPGVGGSNVAFAEGTECYYIAAGEAGCHDWAVMFIDVLDSSYPDQVAFATSHDPDTGEWNFDSWMWVGRGDFSVRVSG